jgi:5-methylcytosine-specific restriction protein A
MLFPKRQTDLATLHRGTPMSTFLLTWNPAKWNWADLEEASQQTTAGNPYRDNWSCGNTKKIERGDRVFLLKQGREPRGILASGWVISDQVTARPHWDEEKARHGETVLSIQAEFERILNPATESLLSVGDIEAGPLATVHWHPQASGMEIPGEAAAELEDQWAAHLRRLAVAPADRPAAQRNPPWQRDELILALDLYVRFPPKSIGQEHLEVVQLSKILNALPIHARRPDAERFRNPNGVYMKLCNFLRFDQTYHGRGLSRGNRLEEEVWKQFDGKEDELARIAAAIRAGYAHVGSPQAGDEELDEEEETFPEGRILYRLHRSWERNRNLVKRAKLRAKRRHGRLVCAACQFDFAAFYGRPLGEDFIECHHILPPAELQQERQTRIDEIALVCSNCHRMIHRRRPWLGIQELSTIIAQRR